MRRNPKVVDNFYNNLRKACQTSVSSPDVIFEGWYDETLTLVVEGWRFIEI